MKIRINELSRNFEDIINPITPEHYIARFNSVVHHKEKDKLHDEIFEFYLFAQDFIYNIGMNYQFNQYLITLNIIKKYSILDHYLSDRLFGRLYRFSYERFYLLTEEVVKLALEDIVSIKYLQGVNDEHVETRYNFVKSIIMRKFYSDVQVIEVDLTLLDYKNANKMICRILKNLKKLDFELDSCKKIIEININDSFSYFEFLKKALLTINKFIIEKTEFAINLFEINNITLSKQYFEDCIILRELILAINPVWYDSEVGRLMLRLQAKFDLGQPEVMAPRKSYRVRFFEKKEFPANNIESIISSLIRMPTMNDIENLSNLERLYGINNEDIIKCLADRHEEQKAFLLENLIFVKNRPLLKTLILN
ncbi:MAG: hypothetical protein K2X50_00950 [Gammaproteobacteria bacterium]|nr:hypothetical protein [Gammaproteobacteria bacterium]